MSTRATLLSVAALLVAIGGIYLLVQVKTSGAAAPSEKALAEVARHARSAPSGTTRPRTEDAPPAIPKPDRPTPTVAAKGAIATPEAAALPSARFEPTPDEEKAAVDVDFDQAMTEANKLYDRQQFDEARTLALKLLERKPGTVRMLRVVVSSSCILGDADTAQKHWALLPELDQNQMSTRCERFDIKFK